MGLSDDELWTLGDYRLQGTNREGCFILTVPTLWAQNRGLRKGDEVTAHLHKPTGGLLLLPKDEEPPTSSRAALAEG